jgi:hypothetical protein
VKRGPPAVDNFVDNLRSIVYDLQKDIPNFVGKTVADVSGRCYCRSIKERKTMVHEFSTLLDEDVLRCEHCGKNVFSARGTECHLFLRGPECQ